MLGLQSNLTRSFLALEARSSAAHRYSISNLQTSASSRTARQSVSRARSSGRGRSSALFHFNNFRGAKILGGSQINPEPVISEQSHYQGEFQDDEPPGIKKNATPGGMHGNNRHKGRLPSCSNRAFHAPISGFHAPRKTVLLSGPSFRPHHRPLHLHTSAVSSSSDSNRTSRLYSSLPRQSHHLGGLQSQPDSEPFSINYSSNQVRVYPKLGEVRFGSIPGPNLVRSTLAEQGLGLGSNTRFPAESFSRSNTSQPGQVLLEAGIGNDPGVSGFCRPNSSHCQISVPLSSKGTGELACIGKGQEASNSPILDPSPSVVVSGGGFESFRTPI